MRISTKNEGQLEERIVQYNKLQLSNYGAISLPLHIVGLGDSTTAGTPGFMSPLEAPPSGLGNPESQYGHWMMKAHPEWTVLNRGINGQRTDEILARFQRDVLQEKPEYVIILAGVNDIYQGAATELITKNLAKTYQMALSARIKPVAATILPYNTASAAESNAISEINKWIYKTAKELTTLFCDTNRAVRDPRNPTHLNSSPDENHPDVEGYRKMGEALAKTIDKDISHHRPRGA